LHNFKDVQNTGENFVKKKPTANILWSLKAATYTHTCTEK